MMERDDRPQDHPGAPLPPPLIHLLALAAGFGLELLRPLPLGGDTWRFGAGAVLLGAGIALTAAGLGTLRRHATTPNPRGSARALVTDGPFRYSRNPLYVGMALAHAGLALLVGSGWMLVALMPAVALMDRVIIAREERYLGRRFGLAYADYRQRVRRWL
jgi:protein-S-isoprenylcysteine O-methyltransferase Ste14